MIGWNELLIRLTLASLFGALIGLERERKDWSAGMRTHMMVCVGSCLIMVVSAYGFSDVLSADKVVLDPSRVAAQVVSGIGFIGAGTILFLKRGAVRGLTTAAGLWTVAAIGLATGGGLYFAAGSTTVIALIILWALQPLEQLLSKKFKQNTLRIVTGLSSNNKQLIDKLLNREDLIVQSFTFDKTNDEFIYQLKLEHIDSVRLDALLNDLKSDSGIKEVLWTQ